MKRHNAMHQSLTGRDLDFDFSDSLNIEQEFDSPIHTTVEKMQSTSLFKN